MKRLVTIYVVTYNEEAMIEFFINHYRKNFPDCTINVYDNFSTDRTREIAESMGCVVHTFETDGFDDSANVALKKEKWKTATTDWVIVCDCDELIEINQNDLLLESELGYEIILFEGYTLMNNKTKEVDLNNLKYGFRDYSYDKYYLFNRNKIIDIGYNYGCHRSNNNAPVAISGNPKIGSSKVYKAYHYKYLSLDYCIERRRMFAKRVSNFNKQRGFTLEYQKTEEELVSDKSMEHLSLKKIFNETQLIKIIQ